MLQRYVTRIRELDAEISAVQALFAQYAGVDKRPDGAERQLALKQRDQAFEELHWALGQRYGFQVQLAWTLCGTPGVAPVGWAPDSPGEDISWATLCRSPELVRMRLVELHLRLASVDAQLELWRHGDALPSEQAYQNRKIGNSYDDDYLDFLHDRYQLEFLLSEQQKGRSGDEIGEPREVDAQELAQTQELNLLGHLLPLFTMTTVQDLEAGAPRNGLTFGHLLPEARDEARRVVKRLREIGDNVRERDRLLLWRAAFAQRLAGLLFERWVELKTELWSDAARSIGQGMRWEELLADRRPILLRLVEIEVDLARLAWMRELGCEDRSADLESERDLLCRRLFFLEHRHLPGETASLNVGGQKETLGSRRDDVLEILLQLYAQAQQAWLDPRVRVLVRPSPRRVHPLAPVRLMPSKVACDEVDAHHPLADEIDRGDEFDFVDPFTV